jgi:catechol 2,3-dioxygenase-like lactoylglutathione lyase family enzyme
VKIVQVDHVGIEVSDLKRAEQFYVGLLGMELFMRLPDQLLLQCGPQRIALFENRARKPAGRDQLTDPRGKAHHAFLVSRDDLWASKQLFEAERVPFHDPIDWGDHHCLYFLDPDENLLELVHAPVIPPSVSTPSVSIPSLTPLPRKGGEGKKQRRV